MKKEEKNNGVSLFSGSDFLIDQDPIEEIFALNLGDFITENLISEDLARKIGENVKDKKAGLINQLKELISIYSMQNTLRVLNFDKNEKQVIFKSIVQAIKQMLDVGVCHIYLCKGNLLETAGSTDDKLITYSIDETNLVGKVFINQETMFDKNITVVPMCCNVNSLGVIVIENSSPVKMKYINLVESIAILCATSITLQQKIDETNKLIEDKNSTTLELQQLRAELTALIGDLCDYQQGFVENLANAVDAKGQYTVSHSKNTAKLAKQICIELGLNEKTTDLIYYAGLLQNIGKIALPETAFNSNGKISEDELKKIQEHSNIGVNFLMNINFLSEVVPYITYQKERYDGSGPEKLKAQSIPFGSRIIAAANSFCAMTADRPYRKALDVHDALEIIKSEAGKKWDPVVTETLFKIYNN